MDNRDWYRAQYGQPEQDEPWDERDSTRRPPIPLRLRTLGNGARLRATTLLIVLGMFGWAAYESGVSGRFVAVVSRVAPSHPQADSFAPIPFPPNGYTLLHLSPDIPRTMPVTIQTPADDPAALFVVTLRDARAGRLVATLYLGANSVTTVPLPVDTYRVAFATGALWGGPRLLFGAKTIAAGLTDPLTPAFVYGTPVPQSIFLPPPKNPAGATYHLQPAKFLLQ